MSDIYKETMEGESAQSPATATATVVRPQGQTFTKDEVFELINKAVGEAVGKVSDANSEAEAEQRARKATEILEQKTPDIQKVLNANKTYADNDVYRENINRSLDYITAKAVEHARSGNMSYVNSIDDDLIRATLAAVATRDKVETGTDEKDIKKEEPVKIDGIPEPGIGGSENSDESNFLTDKDAESLKEYGYEPSVYASKDIAEQVQKRRDSWGLVGKEAKNA